MRAPVAGSAAAFATQLEEHVLYKVKLQVNQVQVPGLGCLMYCMFKIFLLYHMYFVIHFVHLYPKIDFADPSSETVIRNVEKLRARGVKDLIKRACREMDVLTQVARERSVMTEHFALHASGGARHVGSIVDQARPSCQRLPPAFACGVQTHSARL